MESKDKAPISMLIYRVDEPYLVAVMGPANMRYVSQEIMTQFNAQDSVMRHPTPAIRVRDAGSIVQPQSTSGVRSE